MVPSPPSVVADLLLSAPRGGSTALAMLRWLPPDTRRTGGDTRTGRLADASRDDADESGGRRGSCTPRARSVVASLVRPCLSWRREGGRVPGFPCFEVAGWGREGVHNTAGKHVIFLLFLRF